LTESGGSGSGKTRFWLKPNLMQLHSSYVVTDPKGSMRSMQLRLIEQSKIHCAREHFKAISGDGVVYDVVDSYRTLLEKVMR
jgi:restriction endonuclease